ncbi:carboxy-S-adenosyl-L-methionine synthase CmoA [Pseudidiomarina taiwanensis]|uniref:Carboxy-S-adenosyl-L-methionine synthase n=1 Tax=Pseudidiomarina taiwanensis TaxID=337250 RepID=A0A432ZLW3_9GAMM|nr:carboxy-S-adenosyl-L-methionine synthase CmoA [Pseudidiomarina taiwanensis]RUO78332.1 carboxy-S-adenosyl-L-methionine synthase CmoA [Pseudidiomarina taiwanensis]
MTTPRDAIYAEPLAQVSDFVFDERVVEVFPDMINRSVPGYQSILHGIKQLTRHYAQPDSNLYDLGCSLGAATLAMRQGLESDAPAAVKIIAIDNSQAMIERAERHIEGFRSSIPVQLKCEDIQASEFDSASVIVMNFTLQFIPPEQRQHLLERIYAGLKPGGVLIIAEKFKHPSTAMNETLIDLHHEFKRANGYSELEISQKRAAIENIMKIDTLETHRQRLQTIGFSEFAIWFQCYNFAAMLAQKPQ